MDLDRHTIAAALAPQLHRLATPALVIDLDAVDHNIAAMRRRAGERWRPHLKTLKSAALIARLLAAGVTRCKVATLDELDLALGTADHHGVGLDVLLAYPQHPDGLRAALSRAARSPACRVHYLLDSPEHAALLAYAVPFDRPLAVFLDVDLGMRRTGAPAAVWRAALPALLADPGLRIAGLHGYEGHLEWDDRAGAAAAHDTLCTLARELPATDLEIVTSGTHSYAAALVHPGLAGGPWQHRVSPGTVVLADLHSRAAMTDLGLRQAVVIASRVISTGAGRITLDAGSKALAPDRPPSSARLLGWPGLTPSVRSEEHLVVAVADDIEAPGLGELVLLVPDHVCTSVNLYRHALLLRGAVIVGEAAIEASSRRLWLTEAT
ncbi:alanine racemase [Nannocystis sp.]|uniref:alanine racemase n=1 Tax=Nannocystis sp. TaxID=1962667 RepID=UPI0025EC00E9|nr:alanine racemase [Nannocystis sp.]MBK7823726.1 alanine racemase [Nannocystis sp.]